MVTALDVARRRYSARRRLIAGLDAEASRVWRQVDPAGLDVWYRQQGPRLLLLLAGAQMAAVRDADAYLVAVLAEQDIDSDSDGRTVPSAFVGSASDGRDLEGLLRSPIVATKQAIANGADTRRALASGWANLSMILATQVADAGRAADGVSLTAHRQATGYVRMVNPPTCPRCAILAGRWYPWSAGFQRHPNCDCTHIPSRENVSGDMRTDPKALFNEGQVRGLTRAEARAIRDGADMGRVVNVKRSGIYTAGGRRYTREAARGFRRITPEQIYRDATSREDAIRLLRRHGYLQ